MKHEFLAGTALVLACSLPGAAVADASMPCEAASSGIEAPAGSSMRGLLEGRGMGMARAADLNGYPGPKHVLELAAELELSDGQRQRTESLFAEMQADAKALGTQLVEEERRLERLFADGLATKEGMMPILSRISSLQGSLRARHLETHLAQRELLNADQIAHYQTLRAEMHRQRSEPGMHRGHHREEHACGDAGQRALHDAHHGMQGAGK